MALIKCDECGREISDKSLYCPGCGYPTEKQSALTDKPGKSHPGEAPTPEPQTQAEPDPAEEFEMQMVAERNHRIKVWLYVAVSLIVAGIVGLCYYIGATPAGAMEDEETAADTVAAGTALPEISDTVAAPVATETPVETPATEAPRPKPAPKPQGDPALLDMKPGSETVEPAPAPEPAPASTDTPEAPAV